MLPDRQCPFQACPACSDVRTHLTETPALLSLCCSEVFRELVGQGAVVPAKDVTPPTVPMDLGAAKKEGKVRGKGSGWVSPTCTLCGAHDVCRNVRPLGQLGRLARRAWRACSRLFCRLLKPVNVVTRAGPLAGT